MLREIFLLSGIVFFSVGYFRSVATSEQRNYNRPGACAKFRMGRSGCCEWILC